jgi:hypothetical protein
VNHFIIVNNNSDDDFDRVTCDQADVTVFFTKASYRASKFGVYWINYLLLRFGCGHWCIVCDADEFLVYPFMDTRSLNDLTEYLDSINERSFSTPLVDFYSDKDKIQDNLINEDANPLSILPYFDLSAYSKKYYPKHNNVFMQGGVRSRLFFDQSNSAPAMNKIALVKWNFYYAYKSSTHILNPLKLNAVVYQTKTSGALLHFKFASDITKKIEIENEAKQHWNNSYEYTIYNKKINDVSFFDPSVSIKYENWKTLVKFGFMNIGDWVIK